MLSTVTFFNKNFYIQKHISQRQHVSLVKRLTTHTLAKRLVIRWTTLKGLAAIILFVTIATITEYVIVLYAMNLGVKDTTALQWSTQLLTVTISPLFHLVPITVIIALLFSWTYLTKHIATKPYEERKGKTRTVAKRGKESRVKRFFGRVKAGLLRVRGISYLWRRIHFARATIKSALTILLAFGTFVLLISLIAFPKLIPQIMANLYENNPTLLNSMKGSAETLAPIGSIFSGINNALLAVAPGFRNFVSGLGNILRPLTTLDNAGKYLAFQNVAAWVAALAVLFYVEFRKGYHYKKGRS